MAQAMAHFCAPTSADLLASAPSQGPRIVETSKLRIAPPPGRSRLAPTLALGEHLLQLLRESGEVDRNLRGPKDTSFRKLAERLDSVIGASSMWRAVVIFELSLEHPELAHYKHLGVAHVSVLLRFRGRLRLALMRKAEALRWSRRRLQREARAIVDSEATEEVALQRFDLQRFVAPSSD